MTTVALTNHNTTGPGASSRAASSPIQSTLPFTSLHSPTSVAVGTDDTVYVADFSNNRVLKLAAGATTQMELPFTGLDYPNGVAVGPDNTICVTDTGHNRV